MLTLNLYQARKPRTALRRDWRWKLTHSNGNDIANGGQGYSRKDDCLHGALLGVGGVLAFTEHDQLVVQRLHDEVQYREHGKPVGTSELPAGFPAPSLARSASLSPAAGFAVPPIHEPYEWTVPGLSDHETRELNYPDQSTRRYDGRTPPEPIPGD